MRTLLVSTYELGHQPLHVASPAAALAAAGHDVAALDLSVQEWDEALVDWADAVALSVPMHTAMRLAVAAAERIRRRRPEVPICLYGLYAAVSAEHTLAGPVDLLVTGEYEGGLVSWAGAVAAGDPPSRHAEGSVATGARFRLPLRDVLPPLGRYARLDVAGERRVAGYVEATHGCNQRCRHCPVPAVYDGRIRLVDADVVIADVDRLVAAGAHHVTFGDPDFLCGPRHTTRIFADVHRRHPQLTFDVTSKVSHVLAHRDLWRDLAGMGLLFVTSAVECLDDDILSLLAKGHTAADAEAALAVLDAAGVEMRPSFLPFTPWSGVETIADILAFVRRHGLATVTDPVQYSLRLLIPEGSLLLDRSELTQHLTGYDAAAFTWRWKAADPAVDALQERIAAVVSAHADATTPVPETFLQVEAMVAEACGRAPDPCTPAELVAAEPCGRPRLTESWFCCAEPTSAQHAVVRTSQP